MLLPCFKLQCSVSLFATHCVVGVTATIVRCINSLSVSVCETIYFTYPDKLKLVQSSLCLQSTLHLLYAAIETGSLLEVTQHLADNKDNINTPDKVSRRPL